MQKFTKFSLIHFYSFQKGSHSFQKSVLCSVVLIMFQFSRVGRGDTGMSPPPPKSENLFEKTGYIPAV